MIQIKSFPISKHEEASEFLKENGPRLAKDGIKFVGTTDPQIVVMYNEFEIGSDEDAKEDWTMELHGLRQQKFQYMQQLAEHSAYKEVFDPKEKDDKKKIDEHQSMIDSTTTMMKIHEAKIKVLENLLKEVS